MNEISVAVLGTGGIGRRTLDDETRRAANVKCPALGYLKTAVRRNRAGEYGVFGPAELMPGF